MKVCLIDAAAVNAKRFFPHWTPLGLAYIAAMLERGGHEVVIVERDVLFRKNRLNVKKVDHLMMEQLKAFRPELIGISSSTELFFDAAKTAHIAKALFPDVPVVYGGHHASAVPAEVLDVCNDIDMVAVGEGEATMLDLAGGVPPTQVSGLCLRNGGAVIKNKPRSAPGNLDDLPLPARHLLDMSFYTRPSPSPIRSVTLRATTMLTSRGCPFHCTFCVESFTWGKKHRAHSPERIVAELDHILSRYNVEAIYFLDEGFLTHPSRVSELCEMMIRDGYHRRVKWAAQVRVDALNQDLLKLMKEAGCIHLECGFETASDRLLRSVKKKTSKQKNQEIVALIKENGIRCLAYIMAGLPGETAEEFQETVAFIENAPLDAVVFSKFSPHPGSLLYEELLRKGLVKEKFWKDDERCYEKMNFAAMSDEEANALYRRTVKGVIRKINARDRMKNTSFVQMIRETSFDDLASRLLNAPLSIPKFLFNWVTTKFARTSPR